MASRKGAKAAPGDEGDESDMGLVVEALDEVTRSLVAINDRLAQLNLTAQTGVSAPGSAGAAPRINTWEDDPFSEAVPNATPLPGTPAAVPVPVNGNPRLRTAIHEPRPPAARYEPGTPEFRYWLAEEALARGIEFWGALLPPGTTWSTANPMRVRLVDATRQLNATYSRADGLRFFRETVRTVDIHSCESPDVVCHELGHAVLDALKPQLFHAASTETGAFHEAFGDMSAILCALQLAPVRERIIEETGGRLNVSSRLSRLAEQLGWGIRQRSPTAVDRDSLRNAANRFFYRRPDLLPPSAPANLLSTEEHSFSRVFTGAFLDALARMFAATGAPDEANLLAVSRDMGQLIVDAVHLAPITPAYFSQVAATMAQAERGRFGGRYGAALTSAFLERGLLSVPSAMALADAPVPSPEPAVQAFGIVAQGTGAPTVLGYEDEAGDEAFRLGLGETPDLPQRPLSLADGITVQVHAPEEPPRFAVTSAAFGAAPDDKGPDPETAARLFLNGLVQRCQVDLGAARRAAARRAAAASLPDLTAGGFTSPTHAMTMEGGQVVLKRVHFSCGFCQGPAGARGLRCE